MTSPADVAAFYAAYDRHPGDRVRLFRALRSLVPSSAVVLYPGSYVDIAPSVWFDDVAYADLDKRAARFFAQTEAVDELVATMRAAADSRERARASISFHHGDYRDPLPVAAGSVDVLVSLYAGFVSEACSRYLRPGGVLVANNSHGDASMASLDADFDLAAVLTSRSEAYQVSTANLDAYLQPKRGEPPTIEGLHATNRGIAYTRQPFAYVFRKGPRVADGSA